VTYVPVVLVAVAVAAGWWLRRRYLAVTVTGRSMEPALWHGDRVLVRRARLSTVRAGQVVVLATPATLPATDGRWMVKRAVAVPGDPVPRMAPSWCRDPVVPAGRVVVFGDNAAFSHDSRQLGYLPGDRLLGVVIRRLAAGTLR
jgi:signal peptidase I